MKTPSPSPSTENKTRYNESWRVVFRRGRLARAFSAVLCLVTFLAAFIGAESRAATNRPAADLAVYSGQLYGSNLFLVIVNVTGAQTNLRNARLDSLLAGMTNSAAFSNAIANSFNTTISNSFYTAILQAAGLWTNSNATVSNRVASTVSNLVFSSSLGAAANVPLISFRQIGTNIFSVTRDGNVQQGRDALAYYGDLPNENEIFRYVTHDGNTHSWELTADDETRYFSQILHRFAVGLAETEWETYDDASGSDSYVKIHTAADNVSLEGQVNSTNMFMLTPAVAASVTPYTFSTYATHTSGNLLEVKNSTAIKFAVPWNGLTLTLGGYLLQINQFTTNVAGSPVLGGLWLQGTTGAAPTNGARTAFEYVPSVRSLRVGSVSTRTVFEHHSISPSNYWDAINVGPYSVAFGEDNLAHASYSFIGGGARNLIYTNAVWSVIAGGTNNSIRTNALRNVIVGGSDNIMQIGVLDSVIGGGYQNVLNANVTYGTIAGGTVNSIGINNGQSTIGGGYANNIIVADNTAAATIAGGTANYVRSTRGFIGGGAGNIVYDSGEYGAVASGSANIVGTTPSSGSRYSFIGGGANNQISGQGNTTGFGVIGGGQLNYQEGGNSWGFIGGGYGNWLAGANKIGGTIVGGISNAVNANYAAAFGFFVTNTTDKSVEIGYGNSKIRVDASGLTVIGAGGSATASNNYSGGVIFKTLSSFTNLNAAGTLSNLAAVVVAANTLTNNGDTIRGDWGGVMPLATANTNQFTIVFGSQTILDTGLQIASNIVFRGWCEITRAGNTAQHAEAHFEWGPGGAVPFAFTNVNLEISQTNGINTTLALQGAARRVGAHTNNFFRLSFEPYTR